MSEEVIVRLGAPTLAGIKTGSLFPCACSSRKSAEESLRRLNRSLAPKGLCRLPLRYSEKSVLLYLFRPAELSRDLRDRDAAELLRQEGYPCESCGKCLAALTRKLRSGGEFPHEIGLFLSYPPEDVKGFIDNRACNFKCSGLWKVYGDEARAQAMFARFRKCTEIYCKLWQEGSSIEQLAVAV